VKIQPTRNLDIAALRAFLAVVDLGGVGRAASALGLSQAAISQQIRRLEIAPGCRPFRRHGRGLALSPEGERLLGPARRLVAMNDELCLATRTPPFEAELRFGVPYDLIAGFAPPILRDFASARPAVRVSLVCEDSRLIAEAVRRGDLDVALTTERDTPAGAEALATDRLVWVGRAGGTAHRRDPLPVSLGAQTCVFRPVAIEALARARRDWRAVCEVSRMEPVYAAIEAGLAVAPLLRRSVPRGFAVLGRATRLPTLPAFRINLYLRPDAGPAACELADHVRAHVVAGRKLQRQRHN